jgi:hypothetical protein
MDPRHLAPLVIATLIVGISGCSLSASSASISDSIASPFKSSSDSSGASHAAYQADVRDYTAAYIRSGGDYDTFERKIGSVAERHGMTDWELDTGTFVAIGQGMRKGGLKPTELAAWKSNLARDDLSRADLIQQGYDGTS